MMFRDRREAGQLLGAKLAKYADRPDVVVLAIDSRRYVGAQIGIHDPAGRKVGEVSHVRNTEYLVVAGELRQGEADAIATAGAEHGARVVEARSSSLAP